MEQKSRSSVAQEEGKWQDGKEAAPSFPTVLIALVVVRKEDDLFLCNHEHDGWYFPAGRVDYGESFATGAVREALEEAGVPVILDGVLRIEHTPGLRNCRMRVIFQAHAADDTPPKSIPDEEVIEAKWLTIPELEAKRLRSTEVVEIFKWAYQGAPVHPMSVIQGKDSATVSHAEVLTNLRYRTVVAVKDHKGRYLAVRKGLLEAGTKESPSSEWAIPSAYMEKPRTFHNAARGILFARFGIVLQVEGLLRIEHIPPTTQRNRTTGQVTGIFVATLMTQTDEAKLEEKAQPLGGDDGPALRWCTKEEMEQLPGLTPDMLALLDELEGSPALHPPALLQMEGAPYSL
ncbi:NUDIX hydrolase [Balamuthia mandrillaris]